MTASIVKQNENIWNYTTKRLTQKQVGVYISSVTLYLLLDLLL